jgi:hypothetical protein
MFYTEPLTLSTHPQAAPTYSVIILSAAHIIIFCIILYISSTYAGDHNNVKYLLCTVTINVIADDGPLCTEACRILVFLKILL